jgi:hypothetical protein
LVVRTAKPSFLRPVSATLTMLRALPMKALGTASWCQRGFHSTFPPKRYSRSRAPGYWNVAD